MSTAPATALPALLRTGCALHLPGDPGYDAARMPWNVAVDQRPAAVAVPRTVEEVRDVVLAAAAAGLRVAPQSSGHGAAPLGEVGLDDVVLLRMNELTGVRVDAETRTAHVAGGTLWQEIVTAAAAHGLAALHGSAPDVAVAGYLLGGGLSFYGRAHGLAADTVRAVDIVTADGVLRRASAQENPQLFWALRGGGGAFGVVVGFEIALLPLADVFAGMLLWDRDRAPEVVPAWVEWSRTAPESATTALRVMSFPALPHLPPFLSGRDLVVVDGAILETDERAAEILAPLRALEPELDTFARIPAAALLQVHMDPPGPTPTVAEHSVLGPLGAEAIAAFLDRVGPGTGSGLMFAELRHLGGALARRTPGGGALSALAGDYALFCVAVAPTPQAAVAGRAAAFGVVRALSRWSLPTLLPTFTETRVEGGRFYDGEDWSALCHLRAELDPHRLFVANHDL
ncbi:FAD-binding protein [Nocardia thailandica]|uniref:FAD-binding protein n=1 Tax=Nocardia thailandica TaxID=257275 RepID=UPI0002D7049A|nr:FAD-binding protein [Nocardia thailandica]